MNDAQVPAAPTPPERGERPLPPVRFETQRLAGGIIRLRCAEPLQPFDPVILNHLERHARRNPERAIYAQRQREADDSLGDWTHLSFVEALTSVHAIGQWLLDQGLGPRDTVLILSGNSIAHALLRLGCLAAGVTACPISVNYALMGGGFERLNYVLDLVQPKVVFAEDSARFAAALEGIDRPDRIAVTRDPGALATPAVGWDTLLEHPAGPRIRERVATTDPDEHAVYMLTSGSTGLPKAVIQTQRMLGTNLHQAWQMLGGLSGWNDVMLDWLPWSHVSGAFNLLAAAVFGGTLYIDEGKPVPGLFAETLRNLREIAVPYFCNVPAGFTMLIEALEKDLALQRRFFSKLRMVLYGGAGLPQPLLDRLQKLAVQQTGHPVFITTGYGATETSSGCMAIYFPTDRVGIGLPLPGLEVKLVPHADRYEIRLRGDNIMPGYLRNPEGTAAAFDDEGYYITGDAACFHDENAMEKGLYFAGRLAEEFKLGTGSWVYAGQVRASVIEALTPAISDLLLCGIGRDHLAVLGVPSLAGLREIAAAPDAPLADLMASPQVLGFIRQGLATHNAAHPASSTAIRRFAFMREAPSAARHELSDKGTLNQLLAADHRKAEIEALYTDDGAAHVIRL